NNPDVLTITGKTWQETGMDTRRKAISGYNVEELGAGFVRLENNIALDIIEAWAIHLDPFEGSFVVGSEGGVRLNPFGYFTTLTDDLDVSGTFDLERFSYRTHQLRD